MFLYTECTVYIQIKLLSCSKLFDLILTFVFHVGPGSWHLCMLSFLVNFYSGKTSIHSKLMKKYTLNIVQTGDDNVFSEMNEILKYAFIAYPVFLNFPGD